MYESKCPDTPSSAGAAGSVSKRATSGTVARVTSMPLTRKIMSSGFKPCTLSPFGLLTIALTITISVICCNVIPIGSGGVGRERNVEWTSYVSKLCDQDGGTNAGKTSSSYLRQSSMSLSCSSTRSRISIKRSRRYEATGLLLTSTIRSPMCTVFLTDDGTLGNKRTTRSPRWVSSKRAMIPTGLPRESRTVRSKYVGAEVISLPLVCCVKDGRSIAS
mmetsp:Transcript_27183/g.81469  ORF Transcript_27183/g.81469 Transcript_27183/m.81469 type:complete len:218 (+) Transcript_27183:1519-2172(+)